MQVGAIGIGFYEREDYPRILKVMADANTLSETYDDFLENVERVERAAQANGHLVVRVVIKPDEFAAWCLIRNLKLDARARSRFSSEYTDLHVTKRLYRAQR